MAAMCEVFKANKSAGVMVDVSHEDTAAVDKLAMGAMLL
jgi:hypothetical protein